MIKREFLTTKSVKWICLFLLVVIFFFIFAILPQVHILEKADQIPNELVEKPVKEPIQPIPLQINLQPQKVALGQKLFQDTQLSKNNNTSCASCHNLSQAGMDGLTYSVGTNGNIWPLNTPTVFNSSFNFKQNWNGNVDTLEEQIEKSVKNPHSLDSNWTDVVRKLKNNRSLVQEFAQVYSDGINPHNIEDAIATFERSLTTPNSPFDQYLRGDKKAITKAQKDGYMIFKSYGCITCHQGVNVGGNLFEKFGVLGDYFADRGQVIPEDWGRYNVTKNEEDRYVFKVPSLRNITLTAPYFHDGSASDLETAIALMAKYQLGRQLQAEQIYLISEFLETLTGEYQGKPL